MDKDRAAAPPARLTKDDVIRKLRFGPQPEKPLDAKRKLPKWEVPAATKTPPWEVAEYLRVFASIFGRRDTLRRAVLYVLGLLSALRRKNGETMEAAIPGATQQGVYDFLVRSKWDAEALDRARYLHFSQYYGLQGRAVHVLLDETSQVKQGELSVGVARQYLGCVGKVANGQVAVTVHGLIDEFELPLTGQLYLPERWAKDKEMRKQAKVPEALGFLTKGQIGIALLERLCTWGLPIERVSADAGYGDLGMMLALAAHGWPYCLGVRSTFAVRLPGEPLPPPPPARPYAGTGRPPKPPVAVAHLHTVAETRQALPGARWRRVAYRQGVDGKMLEREFAALRVHGATKEEQGPEVWLLLERPLDPDSNDLKQYILTGAATDSIEELAQIAHRRPLIERGSYENAKQEVGLCDYQGRSWHGYHHHLAMAMLALTWLYLYRHRLPPSPPGFTSPASPPASPPVPTGTAADQQQSLPANAALDQVCLPTGSVPVAFAAPAAQPLPLPQQAWESVQATRRRVSAWFRAAVIRELLRRGEHPRLPQLAVPDFLPFLSSA